jgi:siroheme decarboxylase
MTELQKQILSIIQGQFPIVERPFADIARQVDSSEAEVLDAITKLREEGIIRRIGAIFEAKRLGYISTLVAAKVPGEQVVAFVADVNSLAGVSHNYGREHRFNVWFTLTVPNEETIVLTLHDLKTKHGIEEIYSLPAVKLFKIKVDFDLSETKAKGKRQKAKLERINQTKKEVITQVASAIFDAQDKKLVRELQEDLAIESEPFAKVADTVGLSREEVLGKIQQWKADGTIRRFGASVRHHKIGFTTNGMVVFAMTPERIEESGNLLAEYKQVSHCYQRPEAPGWPYNLFAMTHCRTKEELDEIVKEMAAKIQSLEHGVLVTTAEYKKTNVKYFVE